MNDEPIDWQSEAEIEDLRAEIDRHHRDFKRISDLAHSGLDGSLTTGEFEDGYRAVLAILRQIANIVG